MTERSTLSRKIIEIVVLAGILGATFLVINYLHFHFLVVAVILYACILDAVLATIIVTLGYWLIRLRPARSNLTTLEVALALIASNLVILLYSVMGPTVIDRSLSIYIVEKIAHRGGEVAEAAMPEIILTEFMQEYAVADVRMTEQVTSGTVDIRDGCIHLTSRGRSLAAFSKFYRNNFLPKRRLIGDKVTDQLTHPYDDTPVLVPYECPETGSGGNE